MNFDEFAELAAAHRVPFVRLGPMVDADQIREATVRAFAEKNALKQIAGIIYGGLVPALPHMYRDLLPLAKDADVIVSHFLQVAGRAAAEKLGRPFVSGTLVPTQIPSRQRPPTRMPNLGSAGNSAQWALTCFLMNMMFARGINGFRRGLGLEPLKNLSRDGFYSPGLNLVAASKSVFSEPGDWAPVHRMTGYWFLEDEDWRASPEVEEFLGQDRPTIAIGFGSMMLPNFEEMSAIVGRAVKEAGVFAIVDPGWSSLRAGGSNDVLEARVPHSWLLPRVAAIVHHGGAGTCAAAFRAGIPSVIVPQLNGQEAAAVHAYKLGVAPPPLRRNDITAERLAAAIDSAVRDRGMRARAAALGERIRSEDGTATAVRLVEEIVATPGFSTRRQLPTSAR
jgi:sterol 3beta-glucosyltransferase